MNLNQMGFQNPNNIKVLSHSWLLNPSINIHNIRQEIRNRKGVRNVIKELGSSNGYVP